MCKAVAICVGVAMAIAVTCNDRLFAAGAAPSASDLRDGARLAMEGGRFDEAIECYSRLREIMPQAAEIPYNMAVAEYRRGDYERAAELFEEAVTMARQDELRNRATYNLGNTAYAQSLEALQGQGDPQQAMAGVDNATGRLEEALKQFKQALAADPKDEDARVNAELAHRLLQQLQQLQQQMQQQQNQQQDQQQRDQNLQSQDQQQQQQQQNQDQQQQGQQQNNEQQPQEQQQQQQQEGESEQQQSEQQQARQQESEDQQQQQQQQQSGEQTEAEQQEQAAREAEQQQDEGQQRRQMTRAEAERLLQRVRDKERQRREELAQRQRSRYKPAEKDW
jgi:hypothetical protein